MNGEDKILGHVQLGMHVPTKYLSWFEPFQNFLLCSGPEAKINPMYAAWFLRQSMAYNRFIILDNGMNEHGFPMKPDDLVEMSLLCGATLVVAPDYLENREATVRETKFFAKKYEDDNIEIIGVCQGETVGEIVQCFYELRDSAVKVIGFPYKLPRLQAIRDLADADAFDEQSAFSLLGFNSFSELHQIAALGPWVWMLQTGEPIKAALHNTEIGPDFIPLKTVLKLDYEQELTDAQLHLATLNTSTFKVLLPAIDQTTEVSQIGEDN